MLVIDDNKRIEIVQTFIARHKQPKQNINYLATYENMCAEGIDEEEFGKFYLLIDKADAVDSKTVVFYWYDAERYKTIVGVH